MIEITTFGGFRLRDGGGTELRSVTAQPKRAGLLLYLALARPRGGHRRDTLLGLFWGELTDERARRALNQAIYVLRQALGPEAIRTHGEDVDLDFQSLRCDAVELCDRLAAGDVAALDLYAGDLLPGFHIDYCPGFDPWLAEERERLRSLVAEAAADEAGRLLAAGNPAGAAHWYRTAVLRRPFDEALVLELARSLAAAGDRAGAAIELERHVDALRRELELESSPAVDALLDELRKAPDPPAADPSPAAPVREAPLPAAAWPPTAVLESRDGPPAPDRRRRLRAGALAAAVLSVAAVLVLVARAGLAGPGEGGMDPAEPAAGTRVAVLPLENRAGERALDPLGPMAAEWIVQGLAETGRVEVVPVPGVLRPSGDIPDVPASVARETGARYVVDGSFFRDGDSLLVRARVIDAVSGAVVRAIELPAGSMDRLVDLVRELRRRVTGSLATLLDPRLADWSDAASQPPSFEAYAAYVDGLNIFFDDRAPGAWHRAARAFRRAAAIDTGFTAPLLWAIQAHHNGGEMVEARALADSLLPFRDRLPPWDRAMLDYLAADVAPDPRAAYRAAGRLVELVPNSEWRFKHAAAALYANRPNEAVGSVLAVDPDRGWIASWPAYWSIRLNARHRAGDFRGQLEDVELIRERAPQLADHSRATALIGLGRAAEVLSELERAFAADPAGVHLGRVYSTALEVHKHGPAREIPRADSLLRSALRAFERTSPDLERQGLRGLYGEALFVAGRHEDAERVFRAAVDRAADDWISMGYLGMLAAIRGDTAAALDWDRRISEVRLRMGQGEQTVYRAGIAAHMGDRDRAMRLLLQARDEGLFWHSQLYLLPHLAPLRGYPPFDELMRPVDGR